MYHLPFLDKIFGPTHSVSPLIMCLYHTRPISIYPFILHTPLGVGSGKERAINNPINLIDHVNFSIQAYKTKIRPMVSSQPAGFASCGSFMNFILPYWEQRHYLGKGIGKQDVNINKSYQSNFQSQNYVMQLRYAYIGKHVSQNLFICLRKSFVSQLVFMSY